MGRESPFHESRGQGISIKSKSIMKIQGHSSTKVEICQINLAKQASDLIKMGDIKINTSCIQIEEK
jgi:hypothetical protein